jgi:acetyl-CoA C-acetyltransferase
LSEAWIIDGLRSPRGRGKPGKGALSHIHPQQALAQVLNALRDRIGFDETDVEDVVVGCGSGSGDHAHDIGRMSVLDAGWSIDVPGVTLHRFCGSGQQAVTFAATGIMAGQQDLVIGGGVEFMSRYAPIHARGFHANNDHLFEQFPMVPQGVSADLIATLEGFTREDCDAYAVRSQERAAAAIDDKRFERSLVPIQNLDGTPALDRDEHPRPGTTLEGLAGLTASFEALGTTVQKGYEKTFDELCKEVYPQIDRVNHVHHGGNSSGVVDGASAILLASPEYAKAHGLTPRARVVKTAVAGSEPVIMLTAPAPATKKVLEKAGMTTSDIDLFEVNEAFASVVLKWQKEMDVDLDCVNVNGGAIALGHPIGGTGPMLIQTALDELERQDKSTALITMCTGGGMGTATIIERV